MPCCQCGLDAFGVINMEWSLWVFCGETKEYYFQAYLKSTKGIFFIHINSYVRILSKFGTFGPLIRITREHAIRSVGASGAGDGPL